MTSSRPRAGLAIAVAIAATNLALAIYTNRVPMRDFPASGDEYAYVVSAKLFARGELSVPSPPEPRFFDVMHVVNDGKFYGKYPPGWPAVLAMGEAAGVPWLVNPLLGFATLLLVWWSARRHFSDSAAAMAALLLLANPFLILNSASYFSHPACLLFVLGFTHLALVAAREPARRAAFLGAGLLAGAAFTVRPFTALWACLPAGLALLLELRHRERRRDLAAGLALAALPAAALVGLVLAYNSAQTGDPFLNPFEKYARWDAPALPASIGAWISRTQTHIFGRAEELFVFAPLSPLLVALALVRRETRRDRTVLVMTASAAALFASFFFYWGIGGFRYGPRYLFEALGAVTIVSGAALAGLGRAGKVVVALVVVCNVAVLTREWTRVASQIDRKRDVFVQAENMGLRDAIVFARTGYGQWPVQDVPRNGIDFDAPVLFVRDRGDHNGSLLALFPERRAYVYEFAKGQGSIVPYDLSDGAGRAR